MPATRSVNTPVQLYRHLYRVIRQLPEESRTYYRHNVRQQFVSHKDENDPERVRQIISRALDDAEWIKKKYIKDPSS